MQDQKTTFEEKKKKHLQTIKEKSKSQNTMNPKKSINIFNQIYKNIES